MKTNLTVIHIVLNIKNLISNKIGIYFTILRIEVYVSISISSVSTLKLIHFFICIGADKCKEKILLIFDRRRI